jgi:transposase-like protein
VEIAPAIDPLAHVRGTTLERRSPGHLAMTGAPVQLYAAPSSKTAIGLLERLATSLQKAHPGAAASLKEGLEETVTVLDLGLGKALRRTLSTTNPIESMFSTVRRVSQRVTRWENGTMVLRWALAGIQEAERKFRRLMGKVDMPKLIAALRRIDRERHSTNGAVVKKTQRAAG